MNLPAAFLMTFALTYCQITSGADYAGVAKTVRGTVTAERGSDRLSLKPGVRVEQGDRIVTGADSFAGITLRDDTILTLGPRTALTLDAYAFDPKTHDGNFLATIGRGLVHVVTGLIPKRSPDAFTLKTRISTMGVRGTEFIVQADD